MASPELVAEETPQEAFIRRLIIADLQRPWGSSGVGWGEDGHIFSKRFFVLASRLPESTVFVSLSVFPVPSCAILCEKSQRSTSYAKLSGSGLLPQTPSRPPSILAAPVRRAFSRVLKSTYKIILPRFQYLQRLDNLIWEVNTGPSEVTGPAGAVSSAVGSSGDGAASLPWQTGGEAPGTPPGPCAFLKVRRDCPQESDPHGIDFHAARSFIHPPSMFLCKGKVHTLIGFQKMFLGPEVTQCSPKSGVDPESHKLEHCKCPPGVHVSTG